MFSSNSLRRLLLRRPYSTSPSAILSPSDPSAVLTAKQKSLAALSLLKQIPSSSSSAAGAAIADPSRILSICSAASLSPSSHLDRVALSSAVSHLSSSPSSVRSLISDLLLSSPSDRHVSHAIVLFGQARLLDDALATFHRHPSLPFLNSLLLAAVLAGDHPAAARFFTDLPSSYNLVPDVNTYNTILKSFSESGSTRSAYSLFDEMRKKGVKPNATTFTNSISGFYREQMFDDVKKVMGMMRKEYGCNPWSQAVYNVRIEGLCKLKRTGEAKELYTEMVLNRRMKPNWVTYGHLIVGFCKEGNLEEAKWIYEEMGKRKIVAESGCYFSLTHYLCQGWDFEAALGVCKDAMGKNWVPRFKTMKMLVNGLVKVGKVEEGKEIVGMMKEKFPSKADTWKEVEEGFPQ